MVSIDRLPIDEERFGIYVAKAVLSELSDIQDTLAYANHHHINLLITRCTADHILLVHEMEREGFQLMDTLIYYQHNLNAKSLLEITGDLIIRPLKPEDIDQVVHVARAAFQGYYGHYHADPHLPREKSNEAYVSWAQRSCTLPEVADQVLIAEKNETLVGFATLKRRDEATGEGVLFAVHPDFQRQGVFNQLLMRAIGWCQGIGCKQMLYSTQIINYAAQRVLVRLGFEPMKVYYTFHKWL